MFNTMNRQPSEYRGPKPQYWHRSSGYRKIVQSNIGSFLLVKTLEAQINAIKAVILRASPIAKLVRLLLYAYLAAALALFLGVLYFLKVDQKVSSALPIVLALGVVYLALIWLYGFLEEKYKRLQAVIFSKHHSKFQSIESNLNATIILCKHAENTILSEWDSYCVYHDNYPADWDERKELVKRRDDFKCTICEWPRDFKVQRRNLHVHHITRLSAGGDNSLENLTTLCHVCHRQQEGGGHKRIKYRKQNRR